MIVTTEASADSYRVLKRLHPLVRHAKRATELALIQAHVARHGVTACPPMFSAASQHACRVAPPTVAEPELSAPIETVADAARWLRVNAMAGFERIGEGRYFRARRLLSAAQLVARVRQLRDRGAHLPRPLRPRLRAAPDIGADTGAPECS